MTNDIIRKQRLMDLRNKLNAELSRRGITQKSFSEPVINNTQSKATDVVDIRNAINQIKTNSYTDTIEANKTVIKDVHFSELENKINTLATHPLQGGSSDCNSACTGLCVSCTGSCTGGCTSCTSCSGCSGCGGNCDHYSGDCNCGCACRGEH